MIQQGWITQSASVVLVAHRPINADTLSADILRESGITPQQWEAVPPDESRPGTFIAYSNGVSISAQNNRCVFQQTFDDETVADNGHKIYEVAKRYVDATKLVQYRFIGINWTLHHPVADPKEWMRAHLLNPEKSVERYRNIEIKMTAPFSSGLCNLTFTTARSEQVALAFNYHFNMSNITMQDAIDQWPQCDQNRQCVLNEQFGRSS
jgi:hypothetical protein